jgi:hypothetical protein
MLRCPFQNSLGLSIRFNSSGGHSGQIDLTLPTDRRPPFLPSIQTPGALHGDYTRHHASGTTVNTCKPQCQFPNSSLGHLNPAFPTCPFSSRPFPALPPTRCCNCPTRKKHHTAEQKLLPNFRSSRRGAGSDAGGGGRRRCLR